MAKSDTKKAEGAKAGGGLLMGLIVPLLVLTVIAGAGGWLIGGQINTARSAPAPAPNKSDKPAETTIVRELPPIVTNLQAPEGAWIRLQTAVICQKAEAKDLDILVSKIADDTMAFVKTLTVTQLQGATGLQHLREDLNDRAVLRSDGKVKELMIEMLVIE